MRSFTNGFPSRLVYRVFPLSPSQSITRIIPEMNFTCDGSIVGYTVAGPIMGNPEIQVWTEISRSQPGVHYKKIASASRQIHNNLCTGGLKRIRSNEEVFHCNLMTGISVQSGDILGLKLPRNSGLAFATTTKAPTNYVFMERVSSPVALANNISSPKLLPQITLEMESGIQLVLSKLRSV